MSSRISSALVALCLVLVSACGGGASYARMSSPGDDSYRRLSSRSDTETEDTGGESRVIDFSGGGLASGTVSTPQSTGGDAPPRLETEGPAGLLAMRERAEDARSDARDTSGPLLVYTATYFMAVFEVQATQDALVARAQSMGGVLTHRGDDRLVLRVPAGRFEEFLSGVGELGDVLHRDVTAEDVGEEFRDVTLRIRNLDVVRQRLEALLAQANTVEAALSVQRELERVTTELESLRGRQRYLADRVALSTITFAFRSQPRETLERTTFRLPFPWLDSLGLSSLLEVQ